MKTGLVLEGGAMRGLFSAGVMDVMMENGIRFDGIIGVSAGAAFGVNYKSGQMGRALRYNTRYCHDKRYCGIGSLLRTGNLFNTEFCYDEVPLKLDVFDFNAFERDPTAFYITCTDVESGKPVYHEYCGRKDHGFDWIRASASLPVVSQIVEIDGLKINDAATLQEQIARHRPNDKVKLSVKRDGDVKQIDVTLRNKAGKTELITKEDVDVVEALGGKFADAGTKLCRELDIRGGVQVVGVKQGGILSRARVKQGFVITHINDAPVYSLSDMERMTEKIRSIDGIYPNGRSASYMLVE